MKNNLDKGNKKKDNEDKNYNPFQKMLEDNYNSLQKLNEELKKIPVPHRTPQEKLHRILQHIKYDFIHQSYYWSDRIRYIFSRRFLHDLEDNKNEITATIVFVLCFIVLIKVFINLPGVAIDHYILGIQGAKHYSLWNSDPSDPARGIMTLFWSIVFLIQLKYQSRRITNHKNISFGVWVFLALITFALIFSSFFELTDPVRYNVATWMQWAVGIVCGVMIIMLFRLVNETADRL